MRSGQVFGGNRYAGSALPSFEKSLHPHDAVARVSGVNA
jgi:hypothetical protein